eukprot:TRINITY_DN1712_c2_g2_i3.p1 TRINITY_DN1712_c2_g2~~TRINITY_DN1712_c2_g2_i3.p1  ORF type:complete len:523 (+),score=217.05 TRINITY_DN1712_c2_g2_i3:198-1766(+)
MAPSAAPVAPRKPPSGVVDAQDAAGMRAALDPGAYTGCEHYRRKCRVYCPDCDIVVPCRQCHDAQVSGHKLDRRRIAKVQCGACGADQRPSAVCESCGVCFSEYYCATCKLWTQRRPGPEYPEDYVWHCDACGVCRVGDRDCGRSGFRHCFGCGACWPVDSGHVCVLDGANGDCVVCGKALRDSTEPIVKARCRHYVHHSCKAQLKAAGRGRCDRCVEEDVPSDSSEDDEEEEEDDEDEEEAAPPPPKRLPTAEEDEDAELAAALQLSQLPAAPDAEQEELDAALALSVADDALSMVDVSAVYALGPPPQTDAASWPPRWPVRPGCCAPAGWEVDSRGRTRPAGTRRREEAEKEEERRADARALVDAFAALADEQAARELEEEEDLLLSLGPAHEGAAAAASAAAAAAPPPLPQPLRVGRPDPAADSSSLASALRETLAGARREAAPQPEMDSKAVLDLAEAISKATVPKNWSQALDELDEEEEEEAAADDDLLRALQMSVEDVGYEEPSAAAAPSLAAHLA